MVRCKVTLDLKKEKEKLFRMKRTNISTVEQKSDVFVNRILNKYSKVVDDLNRNRVLMPT